jgi:hypothetical protein
MLSAPLGELKSDYTLNLANLSFASANFKDVKAGWTLGADVEFATLGIEARSSNTFT